MNKKVNEIFQDAQCAFFDMDQGVQDLKKLLQVDDKNKQERLLVAFINSYLECLKVVLVAPYNSHLIEFVVEFIIQSNKTENELKVRNEIILFLIRNNIANSDTVRSRMYEIIYMLLESLKNHSQDQLEETLFIRIQRTLVEGMHDVDINAQRNAIRAASSLQAPNDRNCKIINCYLKFLTKESLKEIRLLIIDHIVVNPLTYDFFKNHLLYDSDVDIRNKLLNLIGKKVPNHHIDAKFRREILNCCLFRNENRELGEFFIQKWLDDGKTGASKGLKKCTDLVRTFNVEDTWLSNLDYKNVNYVDQKLKSIMEIVFNQILETSSLPKLIEELNDMLFNVDKLVVDFASTFCFYSLVEFILSVKFDHMLQEFLIVDRKHITAYFLNLLRRNGISMKIAYYLLKASFNLNLFELNVEGLVLLIDSIEYNTSVEFVYELVLSKYDTKCLLEFIWLYYKMNAGKRDANRIKKVMLLFALVLSKMDEPDFEQLELWTSEIEPSLRREHDQSIVEHLLTVFVLKNVSHLDSSVRALASRALGLISLININICKCFVELLIQMVVNDYPEVVIDALKAMFNILLFYSNQLQNNDYDLWLRIFQVLENQFDSSNPTVYYVTCEGFCKLLTNKTPVRNRQKILINLIQIYVLGENSSDEIDQESVDTIKKLKSTLCCFFDAFELSDPDNRTLMTKTFIPLMRFLTTRNMSPVQLRLVAKFYYNRTVYTTNVRQQLVDGLLDEIFKNSDDFYLNQKLIEILIEFNIGHGDLETPDTDNDPRLNNSMKVLLNITNKMQKLIVMFKSKKWKINRERELKMFMNSCRELIVKNGFSSLLKKS